MTRRLEWTDDCPDFEPGWGYRHWIDEHGKYHGIGREKENSNEWEGAHSCARYVEHVVTRLEAEVAALRGSDVVNAVEPPPGAWVCGGFCRAVGCKRYPERGEKYCPEHCARLTGEAGDG